MLENEQANNEAETNNTKAQKEVSIIVFLLREIMHLRIEMADLVRHLQRIDPEFDVQVKDGVPISEQSHQVAADSLQRHLDDFVEYSQYLSNFDAPIYKRLIQALLQKSFHEIRHE